MKSATSITVLPWQQGLQQYELLWQELWQRLGAAPDLHPIWSKALVDTHDLGQAQVKLLAMSQGSELQLIWPFLDERVRLGGVPVRRIRPLQDIHCMHGGVLSADEPTTAVQAIRKGLASSGLKWDLLNLCDQVQTSEWTHAWQAVAQSAGAHVENMSTSRPPFLSHCGSLEDLLKTRSGNLRSRVRRSMRQYLDDDQYKIKIYTESDSLDEFFSHLLLIETNTWKHQDGSAISSRPWEQSFYRRLLHDFSGLKMVNCHLLFAGDIAIAHDLALIQGPSVYGLKHSIHEDHKKSGPGMMLRSIQLESHFKQGIEEFDFLGTDEAHKLQWTDTVRQHCTLRIIEPTLIGRLLRLTLSLRTAIKHRLADLRQPKVAVTTTNETQDSPAA